jgi:hypothetical protein
VLGFSKKFSCCLLPVTKPFFRALVAFMQMKAPICSYCLVPKNGW